jgi:predicted signal transduction protein with EAL and GGDEF domain
MLWHLQAGHSDRALRHPGWHVQPPVPLPDIVKLYMTLLRSIDADRPRQAIVRHATALCCELGVRVVAEGVKTAAERDFLADIGITLMQGYFFARPAFRALVAAQQMPMLERSGAGLTAMQGCTGQSHKEPMY